MTHMYDSLEDDVDGVFGESSPGAPPPGPARVRLLEGRSGLALERRTDADGWRLSKVGRLTRMPPKPLSVSSLITCSERWRGGGGAAGPSGQRRWSRVSGPMQRQQVVAAHTHKCW